MLPFPTFSYRMAAGVIALVAPLRVARDLEALKSRLYLKFDIKLD